MIAGAPAASVPAAVLTALGRLNTHARAYGFGKDAIYSYKSLASIIMALAGEIRARQVQWTGACSNCGGTGKWRSPWIDDHVEDCRRCSRGVVTLKFVETTLPDGQVWHHPSPDCFALQQAAGLTSWSEEHHRWINRSEVWESAGEWRPLLPAERMSPDAATTDLNIVEDWVEASPAVTHDKPYWYKRNDAARAVTSYRLDLGRVTTTCSLCAEPADIGCGHIERWLQWSNPLCQAHYKGTPRDQTPRTIPPEIITPAIATWLARRGVNPEALTGSCP